MAENDLDLVIEDLFVMVIAARDIVVSLLAIEARAAKHPEALFRELSAALSKRIEQLADFTSTKPA